MKTSYFTFGQIHVHKYGNVVLDKDVVVKITDENPREKMFELFGNKWSNEYGEVMLDKIMENFPRGIFDIKSGKFIK